MADMRAEAEQAFRDAFDAIGAKKLWGDLRRLNFSSSRWNYLIVFIMFATTLFAIFTSAL